MKILKGLAIGLLSFLLFLSLVALGLAFMLNSTIFNPDFVVSEVDKLDVTSLAGELISEQIPEEEFPGELRATLVDTITKLEPQVKEQVNAATYSIFDYLLGKRENPELAHTLRNTLLSSDFVASLVDELDISSLAGEFISEQLTEEIPEGMEEYLVEVIDDTLVDVEPWIKEQISTAADPIVDYLLGESQSLSVVISTEPLIDSLKDNMLQALLESPPPGLAGLPPAIIEAQLDEFFQEFSEMIPVTFEINETLLGTLLGTELPAEIAKTIAEVEVVLEQGREIIGYVQLTYKALIGLILLLILCIILINRQVRKTTRGIGISFLTCGVIEYAGIFFIKRFAPTQIAQFDIPSYLRGWLPQFLDNFLAPLEMFSIGLMAGGVALLIVSFVYKPRQPSLPEE